MTIEPAATAANSPIVTLGDDAYVSARVLDTGTLVSLKGQPAVTFTVYATVGGRSDVLDVYATPTAVRHLLTALTDVVASLDAGPHGGNARPLGAPQGRCGVLDPARTSMCDLSAGHDGAHGGFELPTITLDWEA